MVAFHQNQTQHRYKGSDAQSNEDPFPVQDQNKIQNQGGRLLQIALLEVRANSREYKSQQCCNLVLLSCGVFLAIDQDEGENIEWLLIKF